MVLESILVNAEKREVSILDQLQLPLKEEYIPIRSGKDAFDVIATMKTRGAPAIALVALFGVAVHKFENVIDDKDYAKKLSDLVC